MPSFRTLIRYAAMKVDYSVKAAWKSYSEGSIRGKEIPQNIYSNLFHGDMFFSFKTADREVLRLIGPLGATVYFRKMPFPNSRNIRVKDILLLRDPQNPNKHIVREIFATEGTLVANRVLSDGECWVQSSDENLGQNDCYDSRIFGPVGMNHILGRAIYFVDHYENYIYNGAESLEDDYPIVKMKLENNETIQ